MKSGDPLTYRDLANYSLAQLLTYLQMEAPTPAEVDAITEYVLQKFEKDANDPEIKQLMFELKFKDSDDDLDSDIDEFIADLGLGPSADSDSQLVDM